MSNFSTEHMQYFIHEVLRKDLKDLEVIINNYNTEITEYIQLKNTLSAVNENVGDKFKTRMNIGSNIFMEAQVSDKQKVLVDIGKNCYLEMNVEEALKFCQFKTNLLTKECDVLREESVKKRAEIKLALLCIGEEQKLYESDRLALGGGPKNFL